MAEESLIPKKLPQSQIYAPGGLGVFLRIAFILFMASAFLTGGLYLYRNYLVNNIARQKSVLQKLEVAFEPSLIAELERVSNSISAARVILRGHQKTSATFDMIEANTIPSASFATFGYSAEKNTVTLTGEAASYADVSAQSSAFEALPNVASATFGNLSLRETGAVGFTLNIALKK
ncbi:MAG: hypothetical protein HYW15_03545 [Candidatus Giovannonibacteria bacterium]|nr:MAG: hypothetical protein HYW15_03545 [Candidatus Giovannonibacteria bacterium]